MCELSVCVCVCMCVCVTLIFVKSTTFARPFGDIAQKLANYQAVILCTVI